MILKWPDVKIAVRILHYQGNFKIGQSNGNVFGLTSFQAHMAKS